jgi:hypothetical protein
MKKSRNHYIFEPQQPILIEDKELDDSEVEKKQKKSETAINTHST